MRLPPAVIVQGIDFTAKIQLPLFRGSIKAEPSEVAVVCAGR